MCALPRPPKQKPAEPKRLPDKIVEKVVYMVAKDPEGKMVSIVGGGLIVFIIGVCIACVCRAQRRRLRKEEAKKNLGGKKEEIPQIDLHTFEVDEEKAAGNDHVIRGPDLSESAMKHQQSPLDRSDDLRRSQSSVPKEAVDMFGLADEEDMERGRPSHLVKGNGVNMSVSKREKFLNKKNEMNAISMFQAESK